jgi:hypothetical protein
VSEPVEVDEVLDPVDEPDVDISLPVPVVPDAPVVPDVPPAEPPVWAWAAAASSSEEMMTASEFLRMVDTLHGMDCL